MSGSSSSTQVIKGPDIDFSLFLSYLNSLQNYARTLNKDAADLTTEETISFQKERFMPEGTGVNAPAPGTDDQFKKDLERTDSISFIRKINQDNDIIEKTIKIQGAPPPSETDIQNGFLSLGLDDQKAKLLKKWTHQGGLARFHQLIIANNRNYQYLDFYNQTGKKLTGCSDFTGVFGYDMPQPGDQSPPILIFQNNQNNPNKIELIIKAPMNCIRALCKDEGLIGWKADPDITTLIVSKLSISITESNKLDYTIDSAHLESTFDSSNLTEEKISSLNEKAKNKMDELLPFLGTKVPESLFSKTDLAEQKLPDWNPFFESIKTAEQKLPDSNPFFESIKTAEQKLPDSNPLFESIKTIAFNSLSIMAQYILPLVSPLGALSHGIASSFGLLINYFNPWSKKIDLQETKHEENSCDYPPKKETSVKGISQDNDFKENKNESTSLFSRIFKWSHHDIPKPNDSSKNKKSF